MMGACLGGFHPRSNAAGPRFVRWGRGFVADDADDADAFAVKRGAALLSLLLNS